MYNYYFINSIESLPDDKPFSLVYCCDKESSKETMQVVIQTILEKLCVDFTAVGKYGESWEITFDEFFAKENIAYDHGCLMMTTSSDMVNKDSIEECFLLANTEKICFFCESEEQKDLINRYFEELC